MARDEVRLSTYTDASEKAASEERPRPAPTPAAPPRPEPRPLLQWVQGDVAARGPGRAGAPMEGITGMPGTVRRPGRARVVAAAAVALALVAGGAIWFLSRPEPPVRTMRLALTPAKGESQVFRVHSVMDASAEGVTALEFQSEFEGLLVLKTQSVKGDEARVRALLDVLRLTWNGRHVTEPPAYRTTLRLRSDGNVLRGGVFKVGVPATTAELLGTGLTPDLPGEPVRPGDAWTDRLRLNDPQLSARLQTHSTFLRTETLRGVEVAVVQGTKTIRLSGGEGGARARGTVIVDQMAWLDPKAGRVVKMTATARWDITTWEDGRRVRSDGVERIELNPL